MRYFVSALIGAIGGALLLGLIVLSYWFIPIALVLLAVSVFDLGDVTLQIALIAFGIPFVLGAVWGLIVGTIAGLAAVDG